jgi:hypothetical protein
MENSKEMELIIIQPDDTINVMVHQMINPNEN